MRGFGDGLGRVFGWRSPLFISAAKVAREKDIGAVGCGGTGLLKWSASPSECEPSCIWEASVLGSLDLGLGCLCRPCGVSFPFDPSQLDVR